MEKYFGYWVPYSGSSALVLAGILLAFTLLLVFSGLRLKKPLTAKIPGKATIGFMIVVSIISILTFLINVSVYGLQWNQQNLNGTAAENPITIFTFLFALISFIVVFWLTKKKGVKVAFLSAAICAMAGPMVFELPFDLIVMGRTYPPIPPNPALFRLLFFFPLFLIELTTISLLLLSPLMKVTKYTFFSLAGMFLIFAVWAIFGFSSPITPIFFVFNVTSKAVAFVMSITLFIPQRLKTTDESL